MDRAFAFVAITGVAALVAGGMVVLDPGIPAVAAAAGCALATLIGVSLLERPDVRIRRLPRVHHMVLSALALGLAVAGAAYRNDRLQWAALAAQSWPAFSLSGITLKAMNRPAALKAYVGLLLLVLIGLNAWIAYLNGFWLADQAKPVVERWLPRPPSRPVPRVEPMADSAAETRVLATVAGRPITSAMVAYQMFINRTVAPEAPTDRTIALANLLQAFAVRQVLEANVGRLDPSELKDERVWIENGVRDPSILKRIREHSDDEMFLEIYVGANGFYLRELRDIFARRQRAELKKRAEELLRTALAQNGSDKSLERILGTRTSLMRYSPERRDFVPHYAVDLGAEKGPDPAEPLYSKLAPLRVRETVSEVLHGDRSAMIVRRAPDDLKGRPNYEIARLVQDQDFWAWFHAQSEGCVIVIPDEQLRRDCMKQASTVRHLIRAKSPSD
ncbi:MAG: hypothetical protein HY716_07630 [Planctomycetes bacterium]|nr:hypothetical protein [Planctomycetota bacterium]